MARAIFEMAAIPGALGGTLEGEDSSQITGCGRTRFAPALELCPPRHDRLGQKPQHHGKNPLAGRKMAAAGFAANRCERHRHPGLFQIARRPAGIHACQRRWHSLAAGSLGQSARTEFSCHASKCLFSNCPKPPEISDDPTAQYQMSLDEIRKQIHSKIQVNDLPDGGREFIFPAARNVGPAAGLTFFWLIWTGIIVLLVWKHAPLLFPLVFGVLDLLINRLGIQPLVSPQPCCCRPRSGRPFKLRG